jgi:hypothetical protein
MKFLFFMTIPLLIFSCGGDIDRVAMLPEASGERGDIFVLAEQNIWNSAIGETVQKQLSQRAEGPYLRPEMRFDYTHLDPKKLNHMNQLRRNILRLMIDNDSTYTETAVVVEKNYFARNQLLVIVKDSDPDRLNAFVSADFEDILHLFDVHEQHQLQKYFRSELNKNINARTLDRFGYSIAIPKDAKLKYEDKDFMLVKRDRSTSFMANEANNADGGTFWIQQGFMFWSAPYTDSTQLTVDGVLANRDKMLKAKVPGRLKGTYMGTEYDEYYAPEAKIFKYDGHYAIEVRGLWKYKGETFIGGGGPFVQYTIYDETSNTVLTVCGYVYAPKFNKREYIRELDAVLNTIEFK